MPPDIEWDVDTASNKQVVVKTPPTPSSPRNIIALVLVIVCGTMLGVLYRSIPEPPKPPTPTVNPIPPIEPIIDQEARALERGDLQAFMHVQDLDDPRWRAQQINSFKKWGEPPDYSDLYTIVASGTLGSDRLWADVSQARDGQYFRETRFYRLSSNHWLRTAPDYSLWGDEHLLRSNHFDLVFRSGDDFQAQIMAQQLEAVYDRICQDLICTLGQPAEPLTIRLCRALDCSDAGSANPNPVPHFTLILSPTITNIASSGYIDQHITVTLPSPRLNGLYFQSLYNSPPGTDKRLEPLAIGQLALPFFISKIRWAKPSQGDLFVGNIAQWESNRITPIPGLADDAQVLSALRNIKDTDWLQLDTLWAAKPPYDQPQSQLDLLVAETWSVIRFIEIKYGAEGVAHFLNAIGPAPSMSDALQTGLNVTYAEFDRDWRAWLKAQLAK